MCSERAKASLDSNSSDDEDLWEDREISFTQSPAKSEHKKISLINDESSVFPEHSFDYNSNNQMNRLTSMDVDQNVDQNTDQNTDQNDRKSHSLFLNVKRFK